MSRYTPEMLVEQRKRTRKHYKQNKEQYLARNKRRAKEHRQLIIESKQKPCLDCGIEYPWYVMEFDHVRGEKLFSLSRGRTQSRSTILAEIAKCEVVCANCHAKRTWDRKQQVEGLVT